MKKKVGFLINTLSLSGGTERVTAVLANSLATEGYIVSVFCLYNKGESFYQINDNVQIVHLLNKAGGKLLFDYWLLLFSLRKQAEEYDYLIVTGMDLNLLAIPASAGNRLKVIGWEHFNLSIKGPIINLGRWLGLSFANKIVTLTVADKLQYENKLKCRKVTVIPNPVTINTDLRMQPNSRTVLAIGRLTYQKGFDMLLDIWRQVQQQVPGWKLMIVGEGEDETALKEKAAVLGLNGSVTFLPATKNIGIYYEQAAVFVLSSRYEGLPLVLLEAQALGLPTVSFDCETGPREVLVNEDNGFLIPPFDLEQFAQTLSSLLESEELRLRTGKNAIERAKAFRIENIVERWKLILV